MGHSLFFKKIPVFLSERLVKLFYRVKNPMTMISHGCMLPRIILREKAVGPEKTSLKCK